VYKLGAIPYYVVMTNAAHTDKGDERMRKIDREEMLDAVETAVDAADNAMDEAGAAEALEAIQTAIKALNDKALEVYSNNGGFTANAEAYWHAHVKAAVNGDGGHSSSMESAREEMERKAYGDDEEDEW